MSHNCSQYLIPVIKIEEFEKSELSIRLADKMDEMDRTWEWFQNRFLRICIGKFMDLSGRVNEKGRFLIRISCKVVYYLVVASFAYTLTRETGDYYAEDSMIDTEIDPPFNYKFHFAIVVFLIFLI